MDQVQLAGNPPIEITLRRSSRARRISLRVSRLDGRVTLSLPSWTSEREAHAFAREKENWIRKNLESRVVEKRPAQGGHVMFMGEEVPIVAAQGRTVRFEDGQLFVPGRPERSTARVAAFLKVMARERLAAASDHYAGRLGKSYGRITLRDTRSRWGSCTSDGNLMYSWRLMMAPEEVLAYVAAHEVSHLVEMNHSAAYWDVVSGIFPDYHQPRAWLRRHGQMLHAYRFGN